MLTVRARVKNGRLIVDEPTDLPEGTEVELASVDEDGWVLSEAERKELLARMADARNGVSRVPWEEVRRTLAK